MILSMTSHNNALNYAECCYAECHVLHILMLSVVMLNDVMLSVVAPLAMLLVQGGVNLLTNVVIG
jgi:hypothetical protein